MLSFEFLLRLSAILKLDFLKSPGKSGSASPPRGMKLGNARILIFYLSIKVWEQKSLLKSHLGWFLLVFGEGKATKKRFQFFGSFDL